MKYPAGAYVGQNPAAVKREIPITPSLQVFPIKGKDYKGVLYCFRVVEAVDYGTSYLSGLTESIVKFASANRVDVVKLHDEVWLHLLKVPCN